MDCRAERLVALLVLCVVLPAAGGCAADPDPIPCTDDGDCPSTRQCVTGRCRFVAGEDAALADSGAGEDGGVALDTGTPPTRDAGIDATIGDGGCGAAPCCRTDDTARSCATGTVCRPDSVGVVTGSCVSCSTTSRSMCAHLAGGLLTVGSECEAYAAGAETVTRGACRCDASTRCLTGQNCNRGIRHQRDCMSASATTQGICAPQTGICDPLPYPLLACDGTAFLDECERQTATGMGVMARYGQTGCSSTGGIDDCFDDVDCGAGRSCYGQHGCTPGMCRTDPMGPHCYDATDCPPWQDCVSGSCTDIS